MIPTSEATPGVLVPKLRLGKLPPKFDDRTLRLARYIEKRKVPKIPKRRILSKRTIAHWKNIGMMRNDDYGCCTFAGMGHMFQSWSVYGEVPWRPTDAAIVKAYFDHTGGADEGAHMLDVLNYVRKVGIGGNKIYAYVAIDPLNHDQVRTAHYLFGGLYFGAMLPRNAQDQEVWDLKTGNGSEPGSWGGHCMNVWDYTATGLVTPTWGALQSLTWAWWDRYVDECYAVLEEDWVGPDKRSPQGFSLTRLKKDLAIL